MKDNISWYVVPQTRVTNWINNFLRGGIQVNTIHDATKSCPEAISEVTIFHTTINGERNKIS